MNAMLSTFLDAIAGAYLAERRMTTA